MALWDDIKKNVGDAYEATEKGLGKAYDATEKGLGKAVDATKEFVQDEDNQKMVKDGFNKAVNIGKSVIGIASDVVGERWNSMSAEEAGTMALRVAGGDYTPLAGMIAETAIKTIEKETGKDIPDEKFQQYLKGDVLSIASTQVLNELGKQGIEIPPGAGNAAVALMRKDYLTGGLEGLRAVSNMTPQEAAADAEAKGIVQPWQNPDNQPVQQEGQGVSATKEEVPTIRADKVKKVFQEAHNGAEVQAPPPAQENGLEQGMEKVGGFIKSFNPFD